jgi:hypothetical protein
MSCTHGVFFFLWPRRCCAGRAPAADGARQGMRPGPPTRSGRRCSPARGCSSRSSPEPWSRPCSPEVWPHSRALRSCVGMELGKAMQGKGATKPWMRSPPLELRPQSRPCSPESWPFSLRSAQDGTEEPASHRSRSPPSLDHRHRRVARRRRTPVEDPTRDRGPQHGAARNGGTGLRGGRQRGTGQRCEMYGAWSLSQSSPAVNLSLLSLSLSDRRLGSWGRRPAMCGCGRSRIRGIFFDGGIDCRPHKTFQVLTFWGKFQMLQISTST